MSTTARRPPTGSVTFLMTDIVGSTRLWESHGEAFLPVLQAHNAILSEAIERNGGFLVKTEGDSYMAAFDDPSAAVRCATVAQAALQRYPWPSDVGQLGVRMAVHSGRAFLQKGDYFGPPVNRAARVTSAAHGGQILTTEETLNLVENRLDRGTQLVDLGYHRLKDLDEPVRLYQVENPALASTRFPPPKTLNGHANNLPVQRTSFIGREHEIGQIASLLSQAETPLLTLTGPRGIGKTRLSLQAAAERIEWFPDGVWYVRLEGATTAAEAAEQVAAALGVEPASGASTHEALHAWLAGRECLLILDDCGNIPEVGRFITNLLTGSPALRCLATSRDSLTVTESAEMAISEMALPGANADAATLLGSDAGRLFVERAHEARDDFRLDDRRARPISRLLERIRGVPETIERAVEALRGEPSANALLEVLSRDFGRTAGAEAEEAASRGRVALERLRRSPGLANLLQSVGATSFDRRDLTLAENLCREALAIHRANGDTLAMATAVRQLGLIAAANGDAGRALTLLEAARVCLATANSPDADQVAREVAEARQRMVTRRIGPELSLDQAVIVALEKGSRA